MSRRAAHAGFTLVELLAVTAVIVMVSSVVLANNARFGGRIMLENLAYGIAMTIRQAQVYGIAVNRYGTGGFSTGYGIHFDNASRAEYIMFADAGVENGLYDSSAGEMISTTKLRSGFEIEDLCVTSMSDIETCGVSSIDMLFKRPEPDAYISKDGSAVTFDANGTVIPSNLARKGTIKLVSPRGDRASVVVEVTGQISVQ